MASVNMIVTMAKLTHKEVFNLLVKQVFEAYPHLENKSDFISRDILKHLNSNSSGVRERISKGSFIKDDGEIDQTETFLLTWIKEVWDDQNGNQELHDQLLQDLNGESQKFKLYEKELA